MHYNEFILDNENEIETEKLHKNQDLRIWSHNFCTWLNSHKFAWPICKYVYLFIWIHCCCIHWLDQYCALNRTSVVFNICLHWLGVSLYSHQLFIYSFIHLFIYLFWYRHNNHDINIYVQKYYIFHDDVVYSPCRKSL